jgi:hypothetical protein
MKNAQAKKKTATLIAITQDDRAAKSRRFQAVYLCDPALDGHKYVVASGVKLRYGPEKEDRVYETYLFPGTKSGKIKSFGELSGSIKGTISHVIAFKEAGYTVKAY